MAEIDRKVKELRREHVRRGVERTEDFYVDYIRLGRNPDEVRDLFTRLRRLGPFDGVDVDFIERGSLSNMSFVTPADVRQRDRLIEALMGLLEEKL